MAVSHPPEIAVILLDIDHFKSINDRFGHATGDRALCLIAETLRADLRGFDTVARYGGEEFVIVMPGTSLGDAVTIAERLRRTVEALQLKCDNALDIRLTVSAGVATSERNGGGMDNLLIAADRALYEAKRDGRNRVTAAQPLPVSVT